MVTFNITETYVEKDDPWSGILDVAEFKILSTTNGLKSYSNGQLVFGRDMIFPIKHKVDWELIHQRNQTQINKDNTHKNSIRVEHDYKFRGKIMMDNHSATYVEKYYPWSGILAASALQICSTTNRLKCYSLRQLLFGRDIILPIKHKVDWESIHQQNQTKINKDNTHENSIRVDH